MSKETIVTRREQPNGTKDASPAGPLSPGQR